MPSSSPLISHHLNNSSNEYYDSSTIVVTENRLKCLKGCSLSKEPCEHLCSWARHNKLPLFYTDRFRPLDLIGEDLILNEENSEAEEYTLPESIGPVTENMELSADLPEPNTMDTGEDIYNPNTQADFIYEEQFAGYQLTNTDTINYVIEADPIRTPTPEITEMSSAMPISASTTPKPTPTPRQPIPETPRPIPTPRQITDTPKASFSVRRTGQRRRNVQSDELAAMKSTAKDLIDLAPAWKVERVLRLLEN